jgi:hypothetical protein
MCAWHAPSSCSGFAVATELVLSYGDGRVRVIFQHAPVWEKGVEPGSCPPQGLKLFRCLLSRECNRTVPPTPESEAAMSISAGNPIFYRPVPPFDWHKEWAGTSWTWGPETGNRGWSIESLDGDSDAWHGSAPPQVWNLRLPGGIFLQTPPVITATSVALCRLAWMPDTETLLRLETGVSALQPRIADGDEGMVGFEPPSLVSYRCDVLKKMGDLVGAPSFLEMLREEEAAKGEALNKRPDTDAKPIDKAGRSSSASERSDRDDGGIQTIEDALQL